MYSIEGSFETCLLPQVRMPLAHGRMSYNMHTWFYVRLHTHKQEHKHANVQAHTNKHKQTHTDKHTPAHKLTQIYKYT